MVRKIYLGAALSALVVLVLPYGGDIVSNKAYAQDDKAVALIGDDAIKARQAAMRAIGKAAKAGNFAAMHKAALEAQIAFAVDTRKDGTIKTEASDKIWQKPDGFNKLMAQMVALSADGDRSVFGTCKACHKAYRE